MPLTLAHFSTSSRPTWATSNAKNKRAVLKIRANKNMRLKLISLV